MHFVLVQFYAMFIMASALCFNAIYAMSIMVNAFCFSAILRHVYYG